MSCGSALQISKVHLKGSPPVKMTTENLHCCSSPWASKGTPDETITRKITSLKTSAPIWLDVPSQSGSLHNPPPKPSSCPTRLSGDCSYRIPVDDLTGAWLCTSQIWRRSHPPFPPWALHPHTSLCWDCFATCCEETSCGSLVPDWSLGDGGRSCH